jgi:hypothetical protein
MTATIAASLAAAQPTPVGIVVALWPPICLAITLELIALVASPTKHHPVRTRYPPSGTPMCPTTPSSCPSMTPP